MSRNSTFLLTIQLGIAEVSRTFSHAVRKDGTETLIDRADYRGICACGTHPRSVSAVHSKSPLTSQAADPKLG
jgi:hypothetical protein